MEELEVGVLGFVASCVSALFLVYSALFLFHFCAFYIVRHARTKQFGPNHIASDSVPGRTMPPASNL